jgi:hypothetical protein
MPGGVHVNIEPDLVAYSSTEAPALTGVALMDDPESEEELCRLALAGDHDAPLSKQAIPLSLHLAQFAGAALPGWYMAPATARSGRRWRTPVVVAVVSSFLLIEALGLCNTFGQLTFA